MPVPADSPHYVYRFYDQHNELLYIGCTENIARRVHDHGHLGSRSVLFAHRITRIESVEYPTQAEALAAERAAIADEYPTFNVIHRRWGSPEAHAAARGYVGVDAASGTDGSRSLMVAMALMLDAWDATVAAVWDICRHAAWAYIRMWATWADTCRRMAARNG